MKTCAIELLNLLNSSPYLCMVELFTITLTNGTILRYTSGDYTINVGGFNFVPMPIESRQSKQSIGLSVDDLSIDLYYDGTERVLGVTFPQAFRSGLFDYALVKHEQVFMNTWQLVVSSKYCITIFVGRMDIDPTGRSKAEIKVKAFTELLNIQLPRLVYQPGCVNQLYDSNCKVDRESKKVILTVMAGSTQNKILCNLSQPAGYFNKGAIVGLTGENVGASMSVLSYTPGVVNLVWALPVLPNVGDTFSLVPGCDRSVTVCVNDFNNKANFRGTPFIPVPESVV